MDRFQPHLNQPEQDMFSYSSRYLENFYMYLDYKVFMEKQMDFLKAIQKESIKGSVFDPSLRLAQTAGRNSYEIWMKFGTY